MGNTSVGASWNGATERLRIAALAAAAIAASPAAHAAQRISTYGQGGWLLSVDRDAFTGLTICGLRSRDRRIEYRPGAVGFRFGRRRDTMGAWYRIDGDPAGRWQDDYPALVGAGVELDGPGLDNPTGGIVWVPLARVTGAATIRVRSAAKGNGRLFRLRGFDDMLVAATRLGCRFS